eukprot:TRINITY_DN11960_c0_g1_i1.p1 TRINITY_DN11960_c0_g1~~TRINITY_DN11960_c0_g1_i1.p1  ORF type:complete len:182 (-),score=26.79 TRINITY_DN11960_c0_g1_i1:192-737(-)
MALYDSSGCIVHGGLLCDPSTTPDSTVSSSSSKHAGSVSYNRPSVAAARLAHRRRFASSSRRLRPMGYRVAEREDEEEADLSDGSAVSQQRWTYNESLQEYVAPCPHCDQPHVVPETQLFCCQFACGADAQTGLPLRPHIGVWEVARLRQQGRIIGGCGGRFQFNPAKGELRVLSGRNAIQ